MVVLHSYPFRVFKIKTDNFHLTIDKQFKVNCEVSLFYILKIA